MDCLSQPCAGWSACTSLFFLPACTSIRSDCRHKDACNQLAEETTNKSFLHEGGLTDIHKERRREQAESDRGINNQGD